MDVLLLLCTSMYLGTGWSLVLFQFPLRSQITVDNYYLPFVPPVTYATRFFMWMTGVMIVTAGIMVLSEAHSWLVWAPVVVLARVVATTALTVVLIIPLNGQMANGVKDPSLLDSVLSRWMRLNVVRVALWTAEWVAMVTYFGIRVA